jgi:hypothetical protein
LAAVRRWPSRNLAKALGCLEAPELRLRELWGFLSMYSPDMLMYGLRLSDTRLQVGFFGKIHMNVLLVFLIEAKLMLVFSHIKFVLTSSSM